MSVNTIELNPRFLYKYQPTKFSQFEDAADIIQILKTLIEINSLNVLLIGAAGMGKTTFLNVIIQEYYGFAQVDSTNIMFINPLKEQGIGFYRNEVKTFCQTCSTIKGKKKLVVIDDIDLINEQSQHVFRSYIDKFGKNVQFICSCSNSQNVIEPMQSRLMILKIGRAHV